MPRNLKLNAKELQRKWRPLAKSFSWDEIDIKCLLGSPRNLIAGHSVYSWDTRWHHESRFYGATNGATESIAQRFLYRWWKSYGVRERVILACWTKCREEKRGLSVDFLPSPEWKSLRRSTFFKVPSGDMLSGKHSEEFLSRLPAAKAVIYWR